MATETQTRPHRRRTLIRWAVLVVIVILAWPWRPEAWSWTSLVLPSLSPLVAIGGALATRSVGVIVALALPVIGLAWFFPRVVCAYGCPVGLIQEVVARLRRFPRHFWRHLPPIGAWLAVATFAGAGLGYPLFLFLDPLAIFNGWLNAWRLPLTWASLAAGLGLPALLLLEVFSPQLWCRRLCPLGATQDFFTQARRRLGRGIQGGELSIKSPGAAPVSRARRAFLAACAGAAGAIAAKSVKAQPTPPRPPGSLDEENFTGVCVRCGNCAQACPTHIIQPDLAGGLTGLLAPRLSFAEGYCREDCHRCEQVCPSGAITRLALPAKRRAVIGSAQVDPETCLMALGRECNACVQNCPYEAIAIASAGDAFSSRPHVDLARCNGCGACEAACPVRPVRSIRIGPARGARFLTV